MLRQYYWSHDSLCQLEKRSGKKIRENFKLALKIRRASSIGTAKAPRFAFKRRKHCSANNDSIWRLNRYDARSASLIFPELAYKLGSIDWKRKYGKNNMTAK